MLPVWYLVIFHYSLYIQDVCFIGFITTYRPKYETVLSIYEPLEISSADIVLVTRVHSGIDRYPIGYICTSTVIYVEKRMFSIKYVPSTKRSLYLHVSL